MSADPIKTEAVSDEPKQDIILSTVDVADLFIEEGAQRATNEKRAQRIADNWDPNKVGVIKVAMDPVTGNLYIMDGGHRVMAARICGIEQLTAEVHYGLDRTQRAALFLELQRERKAVNLQDQYTVGVTANYTRETEIDAVLKSMGLKVSNTATANTIQSVRSLEKIYAMGGASLLRSTLNHLRVCFASFPRQMWSAGLLGGVSVVLHQNSSNPDFDPSRFVKTLKKKDPAGWDQVMTAISRGRAGSTNRPLFMAMAMVEEYNKGLRTRRIEVN